MPLLEILRSMKNLLISLLCLVFISSTLTSQACELSPLQHQTLLDTYLEFPVKHEGIANCQHLDFGEDSRLILLSLDTPHASDPYTHIILLLLRDELISKHQTGSTELDDVALEDESHLPVFSYYSSPVGYIQYFIYQTGSGFVPTPKMDLDEVKAVRFFAKTYLDYLPVKKILINTDVGLDTELDEMLFLLGQPDSITKEKFDLLDEDASFFHYGQSVIKIVDDRVLEFKLANEGDELAQMVIGSDATTLAERFPLSFRERSVKPDGYVMRIDLLSENHQIWDYSFLSIHVKDKQIVSIELVVIP